MAPRGKAKLKAVPSPGTTFSVTRGVLSTLKAWSGFLGKDTILYWYRTLIMAEGRARMFNGSMGVDLPLDLGPDVAFAVSADSMFGPLMDAGEEIELSAEGSRLVATAGRFKGRLETLNLEQAPGWPPRPTEWDEIDAAFWQAVNGVAWAAEGNKERPEVKGVLVQRTFAFATDGSAAAMMPLKDGFDATEVIPLEFLHKLSAAGAAPDGISMRDGKVWLRFGTEGERGPIYAWSTLPPVAMPTAVVKASLDIMKATKVAARWEDPVTFTAAVRRVGNFAGSEGVKLVGVPGEGIQLSASNTRGSAEETVEAEVPAPFKVNLHERYLLEVIRQRVTMIGAGERAAVFGGPSKLNCLIMAMYD